MPCQIVIPARLASTRLPEKLLRRAGGKSILQHTYEAACRVRQAAGVVIAVDDPRLADEASAFGANVVMTRVDCPSGTDRIAEVARQMQQVDVFVNVQGDEPEIDPAAIAAVIDCLDHNPQAAMATAATALRDAAQLNDPNCVKVVMAGLVSGSAGQGSDSAGQGIRAAGQGRAVYFSRSVVPHPRGGIEPAMLNAEPPLFWHHVGLYAYRRDFLEWFASVPPSRLEQTERLEQLRAIEAGQEIVVTPIASAAPGIDTQEDFDAFCRRAGGEMENRE